MPIAFRASSKRRDEASAPEHAEQDAGRHTRAQRTWRRLALLLGLISAACALAYPFLPVNQDTARIAWPGANGTQSVNAPLTGYWAQDMQVTVPCATMQALDARTTGPALVYSTVPSARSDQGAGMQLQVNNGLLTASNRGEQVAEQPLPASGCDLRVSSDAHNTSISVAGTSIFSSEGDARPRVVGIYSDITAGSDPTDGLNVSITPDTRYQSSPTGWKIATGIVGVFALVGALIAVNRLDSRVARRAPRWAPVGWWRLSWRDATVLAVLGAWVFIGPVTSDDGYILSMARVTEDAGYLTNYHRWFGVAEAPIGWFYHVYQLMSHVSTAPAWIRLPSALLGVLSWLLISREVMPRLGKAVRGSRAAAWAAATVFLVWWMTYNNGVRPEPVGAVGSLLALCAVERALVTRRLLPICLGLLAAALALAATPTGLIAVAPFLVAARPLFALLRQRARGGWATVLAPIAGAGFFVLIVIFADQTYATVAEAARLRNAIGPSLSWFQEPFRYELLFSSSADGSLVRRFPVLLLILCTATCLGMLLRRGRIPGAALGPSRRLIGTVALFFVLLVLTPTKWTHHFGAFAAVGAAMAALTALVTSSTVLRSKRNQAMFLSGLLVVAALAATGPNAYYFVSNLGVPWYDKAPSIGGFALSSLLLIAAAVAAVVAFIENIRAHRPGQSAPAPERMGRALKLSSLSLVVVCGIVAAAEFATMGKAMHKQRDSYSMGADNLASLSGDSCHLSDHVMVERDPVASVLRPLPADAQATVDTDTGGPENLPSRDEGSGRTHTGFHTQPAGSDDPLAEPPHGFTADRVPMWSSYRETASPTGNLRSDWYELPADRADGQLVVSAASAAGKATSVTVEYGTQTPAGMRVVRSHQVLSPAGGDGSWHDLRLELGDAPSEADAARVVATDDDLTEDGWVAATAPRVPSFTTLTDRVGDQPVYIDWPASFVYPCMRPATTHNGISQMPRYRITSGQLASEADWASSSGGGPLGWLKEVADEPEVPSYLAGDPNQSWGKLRKVEPYAEDAVEPTVLTDQHVRSGWWSPGPGPVQQD